jgi:hypothetical protein
LQLLRILVKHQLQLIKYLNFINKCIEKNFDITQEERELIMEIEFASATDENVKKLINSLLYEQSEEKRNEKIKKYLNK